jgi:hypothetical protein
MIIPSRWFAGGKGLDDFRAKMLTDKRLKVLVDHPNAEDCFPGVEIKGGVCYFLWDSKHDGECEVVSMLEGEEVSRAKRKLDEHDTFIRFNESIEIINKIKSKNEETLDKKVSSAKKGPTENLAGFVTVKQLKSILAEMTCISRQNQIIMFDDNELYDEMLSFAGDKEIVKSCSLAHYGIMGKSRLTLQVK